MDLKKLKRLLSSEGGKSEALKEFLIFIQKETGEKIVPFDLEPSKKEQITKLERELKNLIKNVLLDNYGEEWIKNIDKHIIDKAEKNMKKHEPLDVERIHMHFVLGECFQIMRSKKEIFYKIFNNNMGQEMEIEGAFSSLSRIRAAQVSHYIGIAPKMHDDELFQIYYEQITNSIKDYYDSKP